MINLHKNILHVLTECPLYDFRALNKSFLSRSSELYSEATKHPITINNSIQETQMDKKWQNFKVNTFNFNLLVH